MFEVNISVKILCYATCIGNQISHQVKSRNCSDAYTANSVTHCSRRRIFKIITKKRFLKIYIMNLKVWYTTWLDRVSLLVVNSAYSGNLGQEMMSMSKWESWISFWKRGNLLCILGSLLAFSWLVTGFTACFILTGNWVHCLLYFDW